MPVVTYVTMPTLAGDYFGSRQQHSRDWSDAVTEEEEQEQLRHREGAGYRGGRPRYRGVGRGSRRDGFNTGSGYRPPPSRKQSLVCVMEWTPSCQSCFRATHRHRYSVSVQCSYASDQNRQVLCKFCFM